MAINSKALKKACTIKWKKAIEALPRLRLRTITPNCLRVDKATIFFKSDSTKALRLAIVMVSPPKTPNTVPVSSLQMVESLRKSK